MSNQVQPAVSRPLFQEIQIWVEPIVEKIQQIWKHFVATVLSTGEVIGFLSFRVFEAVDPSRAPRIEALWLRCVRFYETVCHGIENDALRKENERLQAALQKTTAELAPSLKTIARLQQENGALIHTNGSLQIDLFTAQRTIERLEKTLGHVASTATLAEQNLLLEQQLAATQAEIAQSKDQEIAILKEQLYGYGTKETTCITIQPWSVV
jgi:hypothetical protein